MKFTKFSPFGKRVVLKLDTQAEITEGGIIIPDSAQRPSTTGMVISCGSECLKVRDGIRVLIPEEAGVKITVNEQDFVLILEDFIDGEIS